MTDTSLTPEAKLELEAVQKFVELSKNDIEFFAKNVLRVSLRPKQIEFANAFMNNRRVTFRGGVGFGKTYVISVLAWWALFCHDEVKFIAFGPTEDQLKGALWGEIRSRWEGMQPVFKDAWEVTSTKVERKANPNGCYAEYRLASKTNPAAARGIHAKNVFIVCDEADGVPDEIISLMAGIFADSNPKLALISNPTKLGTFFWKTHCDPEISKIWVPLHGKVTDNPNLSEEALQEMIAERGGPNSLETRTMLWGEFPEEEYESLIPYNLLTLAAQNDDVVENEQKSIVWGVDPAGDTGQDRSVLCIRRDNLVLEFKSWEGLNTTQLSYSIADLYQSLPLNKRPSVIAVDAIGIGKGVADNLAEFGLPVRHVKVSNKATRQPERWHSLKEQLWFEAKEWFATENVKTPDNADFIREISAHTYEITSGGKYKMESKRDVVKKRLKNKSPDFADSFILTFAVTGIRYQGKYSFNKPIQYDNLAMYE